jgi:hypothetical protein
VTGTVIQIVIDSVPRTPAQALASPAHGIVLVLLLVLLGLRLVVRVLELRSETRITQTVDVALVPLFVAFVLILFIRLQEIVPLG